MVSGNGGAGRGCSAGVWLAGAGGAACLGAADGGVSFAGYDPGVFSGKWI